MVGSLAGRVDEPVRLSNLLTGRRRRRASPLLLDLSAERIYVFKIIVAVASLLLLLLPLCDARYDGIEPNTVLT